MVSASWASAASDSQKHFGGTADSHHIAYFVRIAGRYFNKAGSTDVHILERPSAYFGLEASIQTVLGSCENVLGSVKVIVGLEIDFHIETPFLSLMSEREDVDARLGQDNIVLGEF